MTIRLGEADYRRDQPARYFQQVANARMTSDPHDAYVLVVCPLCRTRMHPRREKIGGQITCPDCGTVSPILPPAPAAPVRKRADAGEYGMRSFEEFGDPTAKAVNVPRPRPPFVAAQPQTKSVDSPAPRADVILVTCPLCRTRMHPPRSDVGRKIKCPDCGTVVEIPRGELPTAPKPPPDLVAGHYEMGAAPPVASSGAISLLAAQALPESKPLPTPPHWTMFSGVFSFPFQRHAIARWLYLTIGFLVIGQVGIFSLGGIVDGSFGGIAAAAALGGVILILLIYLCSFAAACLFCVVRETAAGVDVVEEWPESDWREWLWPLLYVLDVMLLAMGVPWGLYQISNVIGLDGAITLPLFLAISAVLFPLLLLSVMENGSILAFYSRPVLRSVTRAPHYWLLFHLETLVPLAGIVLLVGIGFQDWAFYVVLIAAPLLAALTLIYARLLGRLAWQVGEIEDRREQFKRQDADDEL